MLLEIMARDSTLPCFAGGPDVVKAFRDRFVLGIPEKQVADHVDSVCTPGTMMMMMMMVWTAASVSLPTRRRPRKFFFPSLH